MPISGVHPVAPAPDEESDEMVVAIGASAGGPAALEAVLSGLPATFPGILVAQHMPASFTAMLAHHLDRKVALTVREAKDCDVVARGCVLIAPGGRHMELRRYGGQYVVRLTDAPLVHHVRPAVDKLFGSVATCAGKNAVGVVLTGMGQDGAAGLAAMRSAGAATFAESEESCVVFGMPGAAIRAGAVQRVLRLDEMSRELVHQVRLHQLRGVTRRAAG